MSLLEYSECEFLKGSSIKIDHFVSFNNSIVDDFKNKDITKSFIEDLTKKEDSALKELRERMGIMPYHLNIQLRYRHLE